MPVPYIPGFPPQLPDVDSLLIWLMEELNKVNTATTHDDFLQLRELNAAPERPRTGMIVFADGTNWNPGSGQGVYAYYNSTWNKL